MGSTTLAQSIDVSEYKSQYDASCKRFLAEKIILAWIMKETMEEYENHTVKEIAERFIEGEPEVAKISVLPDETNSPKISLTGVEDTTVTEGTITYDIRFHALLPKANETVEMIINVEAQDDFYPGYPIIKRALYYCCRMVSAQYGTVFMNSHYEKIKKVYSVWICMNPPKNRQNTITKYSIQEQRGVGCVSEKKSYYDLLTAIIICLGEEDENKENDRLLRMLDVSLSKDLSADTKKRILEEEFDIPMTEKMEGEVDGMGSLADGIERRGIEKGLMQKRRSVVENMLKKEISLEVICEIVECDTEYVERVKRELEESALVV